MSYTVGDRVGGYEVVGILGSGGMGEVYKVRNIISDRAEAMKVLLPNLEGDQELADRFMREIKVQATLDHPNIASLHTAQKVGNQLLMIMEYVEGTTLDQVLKSGPIPLPDAVGYVGQVLAALSYAHARGVVHRDIKPANMILSKDGKIKLMDFGIAKMSADRQLTQTGKTLGSLYYMSPEQIRGSTVMEPRSDIYSLGVSLYELVTGRRPFQGDSEYSIMAAHLQQQPVPPIELDQRVPPALNEIILMAIAKDPAQRFQSADAFRSALEKVGEAHGSAGAPAPPRVQPPPGPPPAFVPPPPPVPPPPVALSGSGTGRRGLYVALGAVVVIVVLIAAALLGPRWYRTLAGEKAEPAKPPAAVQAEPAQQAPQIAVPSQQPVAEEHHPPQSQPLAKPVQRTASQPATQTTRPAPASGTPAQTIEQPPPEPATAAPKEPPAQEKSDAKLAAALSEESEKMMLMGARIASAKSSLQTLEREQSRAGLSLRGDIREASHRIEFYMDEAQVALAARDPEKAKQHLDKAEQNLGIVERFLGR